ncbi:hypothetical protein CBR_g3066 [Chara braunii]|uniref:Right handed beta helix domain-containing protein n=1 Tax=Chara braunii TaxID=69332 RepID=A0A388KEN4_CHABU|nr:hypothetical protein CBR_g3066 [Chara braunii]|eukprot:GBG68522.1 hypothetical protein CBR_g3066 [Chara braunii]
MDRRGLILCLVSVYCWSAVCSAFVVGGKDGLRLGQVPPLDRAEPGAARKLLGDVRGRALELAQSAEDKLAAAITAANAGSSAVYVLEEDVVLTKPLPWIEKNFSIKGGATCRAGSAPRRCFIDGAKKFQIFVAYMPCAVSIANLELRNALGGAAYLKSSAVDIDGCAFVNNTAEFGAALYMGLGGGKFNVRATSFVNNRATQNAGGAVFISAREGGEFASCVFRGNSAMTKGGAIAQFSGTRPFVISQSNFTGNSARGGGGALWITPNTPVVGDVFILGSSFVKNKAMGSMGGAIGLEARLKGHICGSTFSGNIGSRGGANLVLVGSTGDESLFVNFCPKRPNGILFKPDVRYVATIDSCIPCGPLPS